MLSGWMHGAKSGSMRRNRDSEERHWTAQEELLANRERLQAESTSVEARKWMVLQQNREQEESKKRTVVSELAQSG